jgi:hypothetical protein
MNDLSRLRERSREVRDLEQDPAYQHAVTRLQKEWQAESILEETEDWRRLRILNKLQALKAIQTTLQSMMTDYEFAARRQGGGS